MVCSVFTHGDDSLPRLNEGIKDDAFFYTLEAAVLLDPSGLTEMVERCTESGSLYHLDYNTEAHVDAVRLVGDYLRREKRDNLITDIESILYKSVCYGYNFGKFILSMSPIYKHMTDLPDLAAIPSEPTENDVQLSWAWAGDDADIGKLIGYGADDIVTEEGTTRAYLAACNTIGMVLMYTERQALERL
jgi:hypothetical protein